jgi:dodecin
MANSIYRVTEIVGTSTRSWEDAVKVAVQTAAKSLRDLRVAEVGALDVTVGADGKVKSYRAKVKLSFKLAMRAPARAPARKAAEARTASKKKSKK